MAEDGPQQREQDGPISELQPVKGTTGPQFDIVVDPETGKKVVRLSLADAVMRALANNVDIRVVSYDPEITYEEMVQAAAEFDYEVFGGYSFAKDDGFLPLSGLVNDRRTQEFEGGVRQRTVTGADWSLAYRLDYSRERATHATNPSFDPAVEMTLTQPLLRGGWPERNLANLRIARVNHKITIEAFRQQVEETVTDVITTYWQLIQAHEDVAIQQRLLDASIKTLKRIEDRMDLDATAVQIKQTEAAVEQRRATLIRVKKTIGDVRDNLARLLADSTLNTISDVDIIPTDDPSRIEVAVDEVAELVVALRYNPQLAQARLAIAAADINVSVARNEELPRLDLTASGAVTGRGETLNRASKSLESFDFIDWSIGLTFEYPIGNRERKALLRQRRQEHLQSVTEYQAAADLVAQLVRERIRQVDTTYDEIAAQAAAVRANQEQLQALEDTERIRGALTPEFLRVKLAAQETLAIAERAYAQAVTDYNIALVELNRATGTVLELNNVQVAMPVATGEAPWP
jgi:outer membrane protein TolC